MLSQCHYFSMLDLFFLWIESPLSRSVWISQIHDTQKEVQEKELVVLKCQSSVLETCKFSELLWPVWIIEKPSARIAQTYFIKKSCQWQRKFFFSNISFSNFSNATHQLLLHSVKYVFILLFPPTWFGKYYFKFVVKYAKLTIVC